MAIPASSFQLLFYLALLVPGVVFAAVRVQLRGVRAADRSVGARVLEAIVASAIFDSVYAVVFSGEVSIALLDLHTYPARNVVPVAFVFLVGGVLVPYTAAWIIYGQVPFLERPTRLWAERIRPHLTGSQEASDTPTAWDFGSKTVREGWVRVRIAEGVWVGGVFDERSRFATYPESRDLFIAEQWNIDKGGRFVSVVSGTQGLWVAIRDDYVVEWLLDEEDENVSELQQ
ncbi:DUF6338 family protein [Parafrigoribacterium soli]|uniref:DUF6338 family protein n=1 Tax=Parafrigoribacterium soli TaxID=3144663 RepID=UPI0032EDA8D0